MPDRSRAVGNLVNFALFQLGWFAAVIGAGRGHPWLGPTVIAAILALHVAAVGDRRGELRLLLTVALFGFVVDSVLSATDVLRYAGRPVRWLCPPWVVALWALFGATLRHSMAWLRGRARLAALLGAICGPLSYLAGVRLHALSLPDPAWRSLLATVVLWSIATPLCLEVFARSPRPAVDVDVSPIP